MTRARIGRGRHGPEVAVVRRSCNPELTRGAELDTRVLNAANYADTREMAD